MTEKQYVDLLEELRQLRPLFPASGWRAFLGSSLYGDPDAANPNPDGEFECKELPVVGWTSRLYSEGELGFELVVWHENAASAISDLYEGDGYVLAVPPGAVLDKAELESKTRTHFEIIDERKAFRAKIIAKGLKLLAKGKGLYEVRQKLTASEPRCKLLPEDFWQDLSVAARQSETALPSNRIAV